MSAVFARGTWLGVAAAVVFGTAGPPAVAQGQALIVFAAASLRDALDDADAVYERSGRHAVRVSYAASSTLARRIEAGAPADVFFSADLDWMNYLAARKLIKFETRVYLLSNRIVIIAPSTSSVALTVGRGFPLADALGGGRLAIADPGSVPAGKYGKAALQKLGVWASVADKLLPAEDVRAALSLVARGEAPLGIVYRTDAAAEKRVRVVATLPESTHPPIVYSLAVTARSDHPDAAAYVDFLKSRAAAPAFQKRGFTLLN